MITRTFSQEFKKQFHQTLFNVFAKRVQNKDWRNETERKIVCQSKRYHEQQLNALTGKTVITAPAIAV